MRPLLALPAALALLTGCATTSQTTWTPTVDTYGNSRAQYLTRDTEECRALATRASGSIGERQTEGAVSTGLLGAAGGAAIGGILGGSRSSLARGAAVGAVTGAIAGGASSGQQAEQEFQRAFRNCLRQRGHNVIN